MIMTITKVKAKNPYVVDCSKKPTAVKTPACREEETKGAAGDDSKIPSDFGQGKGKQTGRQEELDEGSYDSEADEGYDDSEAVEEVKLSAKRDWKESYVQQLPKWVKKLMGHIVLDINEEWSVQILGLQKPGTKQGLFNNPNGLRWHHGQLLVCDTNNNRIQILAKHYSYRSVDEIRFDSMTNAFQPWAVTVYRKEYYISDIGNNQIIICDKCHEILQTIAVTPDISVHSITVIAGFAVVTDHKGNKVLKYNKKGNLVAKYQGQGSENTPIKYPHSVAPASNGSILVSDANNHNIKVLDSDLNYVESFCAEGTGKGQVRYPQGIDVDARGNIYICDKLNNRIVKLGSNGNFLRNLFEGDLEYPTNIAVNPAGDEIAVSVFGNIARPVNQIWVFFKK
ncbi:tripartite motif-containing protein 2-like [Ptychodera flava]|uniref:tripartite motif-containing protein 2-like n=1 Tax=Ptychodera flava TaxID=63121 RepID=UPI00396A42E5